MYKIGLISTHGTGKTTLAYTICGELKKQGVKIKPIAEMATIALERGFPINKGTTLEAQAWIFHTQASLELEAKMHNYEVCVCDRTVLDNYIYMINSLGDQEKYLEMILNHYKLHPYNKLYLVPIINDEIPLLFDGVRDTDVNFQKKIDTKIRQFLKEKRIEYTELPIPNSKDTLRQEWTKTIVDNTLKDIGRRTLFDF
jgi:thymidylate kinase